MEDLKTLKEVCKITSVSRRTIQGFEKYGLVSASGKNKYGYLLYEDKDIERISYIKFLRDIGLSLRMIKNFEECSYQKQIDILKHLLETLKLKENHIKDLIVETKSFIHRLKEEE